MALIDSVRETHAANRVAKVEQMSKKVDIKGDFEGSVTGSWVRLADNGAGVVNYNNKQYVTKPLGFTSIEPGRQVQMNYAKGIYYSQW